MRQQMDSIALWPAFGITPAVREKLMSISPATIDRALKKDKAAPALKGKSLTQPGALFKHRIPIRTFYTSPERKLPGFIQPPLRADHFRPLCLYSDRHRPCIRLDLPVFPPQ